MSISAVKLIRVRQNLVSNPIADIRAAVREQLDGLELEVPQRRRRHYGGQPRDCEYRGNYASGGDWLRDHGARPFLFPAMGSHNGGTAAGQRAMVESLGMTEAAMGMPIRSSMDVVKIGTVSSGDVWMDRHAFESDGVLVLNRVKLHTCFAGPVQSGLTKMMVVGMGKTPSATTFHSVPTPQLKEMLLEMGQLVADSGKIWAGLAILEDGFDQTAELHAVRPADILRREAGALERHRHYFPRLPLEHINVLVVDSISKTYSGTGMDTNVIGFRACRDGEDLIIAGNSSHCGPFVRGGIERERDRRGVGRFYYPPSARCDRRTKDVSQQLHDGPHGPRENSAYVSRRRGAFRAHGRTIWRKRLGHCPQHAALGNAVRERRSRPELDANPICSIDPQPVELAFKNGRHQLVFDKAQ